MRFYLELSTITGMPAPQVKKIWDNYSALYTDSMPPGEAILRLFNFSKYQIDAGKKEKKENKTLN